MAFTKKTTKASKPASYGRAARKKKEEPVYEEAAEAEEVEEVEEDEQESDYEDQPDEGPAPEPYRQAPQRRPSSSYGQPHRQAPPSGYSGRSIGNTRPTGNSNGNNGKGVRITGLFAGKREGCYSGKLRGDDIANLIGLLEEASSSNQEVVFFLWENQPEQGRPLFSLTGNIAQPRQFGGARRFNNRY